MRRNEKSKKDSSLATDQGTTNTGTSTTTAEGDVNLGESNKAMTSSIEGDAGAKAPEGSTTGNDSGPKEDKQLVYAELVLKPSDNQPAPSKNATEYAEIVYVQKPTPGGENADPKGKK